MDWSWFSTPFGLAVIAPAGGFVGALLGVGISSWTTRITHRERLRADRELVERKFQYDRELNDHKRRVELAETVLSDFYQMVSVLQEIRNPGAFSNEWEGRTPEPGETEGQAQNRNTYYVPLARIRRNSEFISGMMSRRYRSRAVLGADIDAAFQEVHEILVRVQVSAGSLMRWVDRTGDISLRDQDLWNRCEADIWMHGGDPDAPDQLAERMDRAVAVAERVCQHIITGRAVA